jgi:hypothetical protein
MNVYAGGADAPNLRAVENTMAGVFGRVLRIPHVGGDGFLLVARRDAAVVDPARWSPDAVRTRFASAPGYEAWTRTPEWDDLLALADGIRETAATAGHTLTPRADAPVLTDDHAPLEWLTDRFLRTSESELRASGRARGLAIDRLRSRQTRWMLLVGVAWALALVGLALGTRGVGGRGTASRSPP